jgi:hypothetical protein
MRDRAWTVAVRWLSRRCFALVPFRKLNRFAVKVGSRFQWERLSSARNFHQRVIVDQRSRAKAIRVPLALRGSFQNAANKVRLVLTRWPRDRVAHARSNVARRSESV